MNNTQSDANIVVVSPVNLTSMRNVSIFEIIVLVASLIGGAYMVSSGFRGSMVYLFPAAFLVGFIALKETISRIKYGLKQPTPGLFIKGSKLIYLHEKDFSIPLSEISDVSETKFFSGKFLTIAGNGHNRKIQSRFFIRSIPEIVETLKEHGVRIKNQEATKEKSSS